MCLVGNTSQARAAVLVLVDIVPRINKLGGAKIREFMNRHVDGFATLTDAADAVHAYNPHRMRPANADGLMKNLRRRVDGRFYWHWDPRLIKGADGVEPPFEIEQLTRSADAVRIPTLLVRGLRSDIVTDEGVADLRSRIPHMEVIDVPGAGHMVAGDKNDAFNQGVVEFLRRQMPVT